MMADAKASRSERGERPERPERVERSERGERAERSERLEKAETKTTLPQADVEDDDAKTNEKYEAIKRGETHISSLQKMTIKELLEVAKKESVTEYTGLKKQDLIFHILKQQVNQNGDDVWRRRAGNPAGRVRLPALAGLQLPALPRRHLRVARPDPPLQPAHRRHSSRARSGRPRRTSATSRCSSRGRSTAKEPEKAQREDPASTT